MAQTSFPFENADTTETQYSWLFRNFSTLQGGGVQGVPGDTTLKVTPGTGLTTSVAAGQAMVRGHYYSNTAAVVLTHDPSTSNPRIDSVVLTLDPTANSIVLSVVKGTAGVSPVAPSLTQTDSAIYQFKIADVTIQSSAISISTGDINDQRTFLKPVWTSADRPTPYLGLFGWNTTLGTLEGWNGTTWVSVNPTSLDASVITSGTIASDRLPGIQISGGGTGASSAAAARTSLGITPGNIGAADAVHYHVIGDVTNLQTALNGKQAAGSYAAASHTHDAGAVVSGVFSTDRLPTIPTSKFGQGDWNNGVYTIAANNLTGGYLDVWGGVKSTGVYNTSVTYGSYRAVWVNVDGTLGQTASTRTVKQDITPASIAADAILGVEIVNFRYIDAVEAQGENAPVEIGVIAEQLLEVPGMEKFVYFDEDGKPAGVHYERLAIAVIPQLQAQAARLDELEARLAKLEK